jgi:hypothetical protein
MIGAGVGQEVFEDGMGGIWRIDRRKLRNDACFACWQSGGEGRAIEACTDSSMVLIWPTRETGMEAVR